MSIMTADEVRRLLDYDPETGDFRWRVEMGQRAKMSAIAGTIKEDGYRIIIIRRRKYSAHRLAWLHSYGCWPVQFLDHKNGLRDDNRLCNLREATRSQNNSNRPAISGLKGASWHAPSNRWVARIKKDGVQRHIGCFPTEEAAHAAYCRAAQKLHGEFARTQ